MLDMAQWTTGQQFTIVEVKPPPPSLTFVRYQVVLKPQDDPEGQVLLWCETHTAGASPVQAKDVVEIKGKTLTSILVERLSDGSRYLLVVPSYDTDFDAWAQQQAEALRAKQWDQLDIEHLAEEVEELRKTERRGVRSQLRLILSHLLKWAYQSARRTDSWHATIANGRVLVQEDLEDSPSLAHDVAELFKWAYPRARRDAARETGLPLTTFPEACPWPIVQVLNEDFWPPDTPASAPEDDKPPLDPRRARDAREGPPEGPGPGRGRGLGRGRRPGRT
jgi:hypothetical protein